MFAYLQLKHLVYDQAVIHEEGVPSDDGEVGKQLAQTRESSHSVDEQVIGDLMELGEAEPLVVRLIGPVYQHDTHKPFHNTAPAQTV